nr:palmitoyltransferase ZDHHC3-like isoform X1 [Dromaius novaehollandiae]
MVAGDSGAARGGEAALPARVAKMSGLWCPFHAVAFNLVVLLLLASHGRAVLADPGVVPLPATAIDFSDLRSGAPRSDEDWTVCNRCETYRPPRAHHCRVCHRCVRRMDHHCPWINNCVGELNQKYFIQFLFYTGLASLYAMGLVLATWLRPADRSPAGTAAGMGGDVSDSRVQTAHCIVLLVESVLFGAFVTVIFYDQVMSIITDETPLEQIRDRVLKEASREATRSRKPKLALLREVFGRAPRRARALLTATCPTMTCEQPAPDCQYSQSRQEGR